MADRLDDAADLAVSELRRKARRRLVGAIVLALAAAILLPLLLESDPRPLGDAVSIQIPPVDNDKFVSRLSPAAPKVKDGKPEGKSGAAPVTPSLSTNKAAPAPAAIATAPAVPVNASPPTAVNAPASAGGGPAAEFASQPVPPVSSQPAPAAASQPPAGASPPTPAPLAQSASAPSAEGGATPAAVAPIATGSPESASAGAETRKPGSFVIQLAAFTDDKGANALANRVRKEGFPAYTEPYRTKTGTVWRVRVGGYPTRAQANEALVTLKTAGHKGLVSAVK